jgi:putative FmdB family regulatory protein
MPLYEFECQTCAQRFETLVRGGEQPVCPACRGTRLERALSTFAVNTRSSSPPAPGACGRCGDPRGPGACSMN